MPVAEEEPRIEVISPGAIEALERANIDLMISTAKRYPRNVAKIAANMKTLATLDEEVAIGCFYTLERKDADGKKKLIQGKSIRLAEIAVTCYQNIRAGARIIDNDGSWVTAQGA